MSPGKSLLLFFSEFVFNYNGILDRVL